MLYRLTSLLGIFVLIGLAWLLSENRRRFPARLVAWGVALQILFCVLVLGIPALGFSGPLFFLFEAANNAINATIAFTLEGSRFVFGNLLDKDSFGFIFAVQVLPTIIFISSLMSVLYHLGIMQKITHAFALVMQRTMKTSGAETLAAAANIFVGQTEAPLVIKPFLAAMTRSELLCVMVGGMANTAGGVLAAYVILLRDRIPEIGGHLLTASILSAPAALLFSKILVPETARPQTYGTIPQESKHSPHANLIDAAAQGAGEGLTLALNVAAMLLGFIALIAAANSVFALIGDAIGFASWGQALIPEDLRTGGPVKLSFQLILGWLFAPVAWIIGVPYDEIALAGGLLGEKTILNEFVAYSHLSDLSARVSDRTFILMSYALSGFANFASIAIQIGGISPLAPTRRADLARLGLRALIGGTLASMLTGAVVGLFI
ncbi:MAG: NupC/NupG family nucleoside CNT transporter [Bdellovibrionales bacterium]